LRNRHGGGWWWRLARWWRRLVVAAGGGGWRAGGGGTPVSEGEQHAYVQKKDFDLIERAVSSPFQATSLWHRGYDRRSFC
jgi:hypothetical protein